MVSWLVLNMKHVIVLLGDVCVGKTFLFDHVRGNVWNECYMTTTCLDVCNVVGRRVDGVNVSLEIWDTPGHRFFQQCVDIVIKKSSFACMVFSTASKTSYDTCMRWYTRLKHSHDCLLVVVDTSKRWSEWSNIVSTNPMPFILIQHVKHIQLLVDYMIHNLNHNAKDIFDKIIASITSKHFW